MTKLIEEIAAVERARDTDALQRARDERAAVVEVSLDAGSALAKSEQARILTLARDVQTLDERFRRWFPPSSEHAVTEQSPREQSTAETSVAASARDIPQVVVQPSDADAPLIETVQTVLLAVAEVTELVGGEPAQRQLDAIEMFERLLLERRLSFLHYQRLRDRYTELFRAEIAKIWDATSGGYLADA